MRKAEVGVMHFGSGGEPQTKECRWSLEAEKGKKKDLLLEPLIPAQRGLFWTFLFQDCKIINMCCFQTLSVWQFVPHYGVSFLTVVPCEPHGWYLLSGIGPSHALLPGTYLPMGDDRGNLVSASDPSIKTSAWLHSCTFGSFKMQSVNLRRGPCEQERS